MYGNYWEYGWNGTRTDEALPACSTLAPHGAGAKWDEDRAFCTTNHFMRTQLHTAPFRAWTDAGGADAGSVLNHGRSGAVLLDAGDAAYRAHLGC